MREFEERVRRLKERQAEFYKNKQLNQTSTWSSNVKWPIISHLQPLYGLLQDL
jgi:hypothetical protein